MSVLTIYCVVSRQLAKLTAARPAIVTTVWPWSTYVDPETCSQSRVSTTGPRYDGTEVGELVGALMGMTLVALASAALATPRARRR